ncbi:sulfatase-like hydrolase/transferase [Acidobacteria bacterium AH-259-A15]|nr:sulfatase-like hydrolase/transferase [Acidobacteria bacterium AH-259-A15]
MCSDQHSYKYTGYAGHPLVKTPNLDRIAGEGVIFTDAYCGSPVCVPGRSSMMTGMYASDCNSFCNSTVWDGSHPSWGKCLRDAGYYCLATGKMDLNDDFDSGFEEIETSHGHRHRPDITSLFRQPVAYRMGERPNVDGRPRQKRHRDGRRADAALKFLREDSQQLKQPWTLYVGFTEPHPRFVALQKYYDMYPTYSIDMPNIPPGHLEDLHLMFQELRHFKRIAAPIPEERIRRARAGYYGMISELDEYIGQIWQELERTNQLENTLFIYTSDHGESLGEHGLWHKNNLYDVAARIPLVMAGPGFPKGVKVSTPAAHVDMVATILELSGAGIPATLRGHSLLPLMRGRSGDHPGFAYSESHSEGNCTGSFMIRKGDWKYLHFTWYDNLLFNVAQDPGEFNNRIHDPAAKRIKNELQEILRAQVDPEEVTQRAFSKQGKMLGKMAKRMSEEELFTLFKGRMGPGLARVLARSSKGMYRFHAQH